MAGAGGGSTGPAVGGRHRGRRRAGGREAGCGGEAGGVPGGPVRPGLEALAQFVEREGHAVVKRPHKEPVEAVEAGPGEEQALVSQCALGTWSNNQKARRAKLTPGQLAQLTEHGVEWA
ncbi:helicase associated domain-containing protein [Kitasatospora sp. NPDC088351]|uniref:helicase associated domain-containing protein n=1 Tax=Kitasatospora sp. NPDC088351 TaxID=3155180 RepID=UPI0034121E0E